MVKKSVEMMWENYLHRIPESEREGKTYTSWAFGSGPEMAKELAELVCRGEKTATCSLYLLYETEEEALPFVGELNIITDWDGEAEAITETVDVQIIPFHEVSPEFAFKEGEGDRSYAYWRRVHVDFFTEELKEQKESFDENMLVVCEEFKIVYKK